MDEEDTRAFSSSLILSLNMNRSTILLCFRKRWYMKNLRHSLNKVKLPVLKFYNFQHPKLLCLFFLDKLNS